MWGWGPRTVVCDAGRGRIQLPLLKRISVLMWLATAYLGALGLRRSESTCSRTLTDWAIDPPRRVTLVSRMQDLVRARVASMYDLPVPRLPYQSAQFGWCAK